MNSIEQEKNLIVMMMKLISQQFGDHTEIVLHDWSRGYEHSISAIENGQVTGRKVGECGSNLGLEILRGTKSGDINCNYVTRTKDGRVLRSSTLYLKNDAGEAIGALCINTDITDLLSLQETVGHMIPQGLITKESEEFFATDVDDLLNYMIGESLKLVNKPVADMSKEDKMRALCYLDEKGALLISKSGNKICQALEISKFTLYNYLDQIRDKPVLG